MTKKLHKMAVAAAISAWGATAVKSAEAASVKLTFFEDADTPAVGVGSFSYDNRVLMKIFLGQVGSHHIEF